MVVRVGIFMHGHNSERKGHCKRKSQSRNALENKFATNLYNYQTDELFFVHFPWSHQDCLTPVFLRKYSPNAACHYTGSGRRREKVKVKLYNLPAL